MTKSILISIRPEHVYDILNGSKTLELRKSVPKDFVGWVYVYVTKAKPELLYALGGCGDNGSCSSSCYILNDYLSNEEVEIGIKNGDILLNGKVVARFWFDDYDDVSIKYRIDKNQIERVIEQACISYEDFDKYVGDRENIYGWHIKNLEIFDEPMALSDFYGEQQIEYDWRDFYKTSDGFTPL